MKPDSEDVLKVFHLWQGKIKYYMIMYHKWDFDCGHTTQNGSVFALSLLFVLLSKAQIREWKKQTAFQEDFSKNFNQRSKR